MRKEKRTTQNSRNSSMHKEAWLTLPNHPKKPQQSKRGSKIKPNRVEEFLVPASQPPTQPLQFLLVCLFLVLGVPTVPEIYSFLRQLCSHSHSVPIFHSTIHYFNLIADFLRPCFCLFASYVNGRKWQKKVTENTTIARKGPSLCAFFLVFSPSANFLWQFAKTWFDKIILRRKELALTIGKRT